MSRRAPTAVGRSRRTAPPGRGFREGFRGIWIIYLAADKTALAWIALAILALVALLGWTMFAIWFRRRQAHAGAAAAAAPGSPPEQHFPVAVVALHGLLAVTTVVLVLLTALGVGGS